MPAVPVTTVGGGAWLMALLGAGWAINTEHAQEIKVRRLRASLLNMQKYRPRRTHPFFGTCIDVVLIHCAVVLLGTREREEAHVETIRRLAEKDEQAVEPTQPVPRV